MVYIIIDMGFNIYNRGVAPTIYNSNILILHIY